MQGGLGHRGWSRTYPDFPGVCGRGRMRPRTTGQYGVVAGAHGVVETY